MCVRESTSRCFHKIRLFDVKPPEIAFMMTLVLIWDHRRHPPGPSAGSSALTVTAYARADCPRGLGGGTLDWDCIPCVLVVGKTKTEICSRS